MAGFFKNLFKSFTTFPEDDDDEDYEEYVAETENKEAKEKAARLSKKSEYAEEHENNHSASRGLSRGLDRPSKIVPLRSSSTRTVRDLEVTIIKPDDFSDCQEICDRLLEGKATVINLVGFDEDFAQRIMDFVSGAVYVVDGKLHGIDNYIFIACPANVDISGDYLELVAINNGLDSHNLSKDY